MTTSDPDAHVECQPGWELHYEQLSAGAFRGSIDHVHLPGMSLLREGANCGVRQWGQMASSAYGMAIPVRMAGSARFSGQRLSIHSVMVGPSNDLELCSAEPLLLSGIIVDADLLNSLHERIFDRPLSSWLERQVVVQVPPNLANSLRETLLQAFEAFANAPGLLGDPIAYRQLRDAVLMEWQRILPSEVDTSGLKSATARRKVVDRACTFISAHSNEPLSLLELCTRIGACERKLNYCFQDVLGISPGRYLRAVRLNGVRRAFKNVVDTTLGVQDIAAHWGFWHLSQFSADYKHQFAELPSETLRKGRQHRQE